MSSDKGRWSSQKSLGGNVTGEPAAEKSSWLEPAVSSGKGR